MKYTVVVASSGWTRIFTYNNKSPDLTDAELIVQAAEDAQDALSSIDGAAVAFSVKRAADSGPLPRRERRMAGYGARGPTVWQYTEDGDVG